VNVTPFEPEWEGFVTLEISNTTPLPAKFTPTKPLPGALFRERRRVRSQLQGQKGKYQAQGGIVLPRL